MAASALMQEPSANVVAFPGCPTSRRFSSQPVLSAEDRIDLDRLRWLALRSQLAPKPDLERACFLLAGEREVSFERFAITFFRGLSAAASTSMEMYRPGTPGLSDDEIWLMRLVAALKRGDGPAAGALVSWRVLPKGRRWLRFLAAGMVDGLEGTLPVGAVRKTGS